MANQEDFEENDASARHYSKPLSGSHPIPTIQRYREHRRELDSQLKDEEAAQQGPEDQSKAKRAFHSAKAAFNNDQSNVKPGHDPYPSSNHNYADSPDPDLASSSSQPQLAGVSDKQSLGDSDDDRRSGHDTSAQGGQQEISATEAVAGAVDPRQKRKAMKKTQRQGRGREVTDPVTHLPITIHDQTEKDLEAAPENDPEPGATHWTATGPRGQAKTESQLELERIKSQRGYNGMQRVFPPPDFERTRDKLATIYQQAVVAGLGTISILALCLFAIPSPVREDPSKLSWLFTWSKWIGGAIFAPLGSLVVLGMGRWVNKKSNEIFDDETWDASRQQELAVLDSQEELPESAQWLNSLFSSVWPLINPDLFASLGDTIEDVMQASLPKAIKMVSVDDMGQGSESVRVLGVRWLPSGAASQSVNSNGKAEKAADKKQSDRSDPEIEQDDAKSTPANGDDQDENDHDTPQTKQDQQEQTAIREGMEAEEGDFINLELALAYRSRSSGRSLKEKAKNAHLYLKFYLPGGIAIPVWVELRGIIMTMRVRLQLTPDPPFFSLCTLTFLGQPKASMSCVPLSKHNLNLMDVPLVSSFVQSAIDAALAEYVAPKSLTLNLKDMLVGADFKQDTTSKGVIWICIKHARGFKQGDGGVGPMDGSSDSYVTVSWGKFGKPVASTRIIEGENEPSWHEYTSILVTPEEVNAQERLRLQLWDSDKWSADDDLGRVEVDLKTLMQDPASHNKIQDREDRFYGQDPDETMPGTLTWSVGYFAKTKITPQQLEQQDVNPDIKDKDQLKQHVSDTAERKLREANKPADDEEVRQQKLQDYRELEESMIISAPPSEDYPSGVLSIQVHNITGLEIAKLQKDQQGDEGDHEDEAEEHGDMPDSYCTIIMDHKKIFRTRTKPKNSKPFFNAGTERFVRDWRQCEMIVSVRDAREREDDPLIGIVYLPLAKLLEKRSQVMDNYPLVGGVGYGRARISIVWRSVDLQLPRQLHGWDYGTLEINGPIKTKGDTLKDLTQNRIKVRTNLGHRKMQPENGQWLCKGRNGPDNPFLPVRKRYASPMIIEFRKSIIGPDRTSAFAVLWLQELIDEEYETKTLKVWKGGKSNIRKASSCYEYNGTEEGEVPLGEVEVNVRFWRGLSGYHKAYAASSKNGDMRNVMECLDTITDEKLDAPEDSGEGADDHDADSETRKKKLRVHTNDDSSRENSEDDASSDDSSEISLPNFRKKFKNILHNPVDGVTETAASVAAPGHNDPDDGKRGVRSEIRDYKDHHKQLHRKHRGIMQWRVAREADHIGGKLSGLRGNISGIFKHSDKDVGVETEV